MEGAHRASTALWTALLCLACSEGPTGMVLRFEGEEPLLARASHIALTVTGPEGASVERTIAAGGLPHTILITPDGGDAARRFSVDARLLDATGAPLGAVRARGSFVEGERRVLPLCFERACAGVACDDGETCASGRCIGADAVHARGTTALRTYELDGELPPCALAVPAPSRPDGARLPIEGDDVAVTSTCRIDTSTCSSPCGGSLATDAAGAHCVWTVGTLHVAPTGTLRAIGDRPLVVLAAWSVLIEGTLDAAAHGEEAGPGGGPAGVDASGGGDGVGGGDAGGGRGATSEPFDPGGGGGGACGAGGHGGDAGGWDGGAGGAGRELAAWLAGPLRGGSGGGTGGSDARAGNGGAGGGAIQISAAREIVVSGAILAGGGGGGGGVGTSSGGGGGGGGGGSGGAIVLEAPSLSLDGASLIAGGGGGGGAATREPSMGGEPGEDASDAEGCALGGASGDGSHGTGGGGEPCVDGASGGRSGSQMAAPNGGGGAGGAGFVVLRALAPVEPTWARMLPGPDTPCFVEEQPTTE